MTSTSDPRSTCETRPAVDADDPVRVLIVDDHEMVATAIRAVLDRESTIEVVGVASAVTDAIATARQVRPDVVVMDFQLGSERTPPFFDTLREAAGGCAILVLTGWSSERAMLESFDAGASGFLSKDQSMTMLVDGVARVVAGEVVVAPDLLAALAARSMRDRPDRLSRRELEIVDLLAHGADTAAIAETLGLSAHTVRNHVAKLSLRLGVHSRLEAVSEAIRRGIISPPGPAHD